MRDDQHDIKIVNKCVIIINVVKLVSGNLSQRKNDDKVMTMIIMIIIKKSKRRKFTNRQTNNSKQ